MTEKVEIREGQRWRSRDKRDNGKIVTVIRICGDTVHANGHVVVQGFVRSTMRASTLRGRYRLVHGSVAADFSGGSVGDKPQPDPNFVVGDKP